MRGKLGDRVRLLHILEAIKEIDSYVGNVDFNSFSEHSMMRFACIKHMEIIGEASNHISSEMKLEFSEIEWGQIIGMRNVFVHEYFGIDNRLVWDIIMHDLPRLRSKIESILQSIE